MESLTVAETETEDDSAYIDIEGNIQLTAESTNNIVKNCLSTLGADKNGTLVFVNFSAQDASILKISVHIIKRRS